MNITLNTNEVANQLRQDQYASYSYKGSIALAEYLEELEESIGEPMELDIVAIRCDFTEHESLIDAVQSYFMNYREEFGIVYENPLTNEIEENSATDCDGNFHDEVFDSVIKYFEENTTLIQFDGGIIIQDF